MQYTENVVIGELPNVHLLGSHDQVTGFGVWLVRHSDVVMADRLDVMMLVAVLGLEGGVVDTVIWFPRSLHTVPVWWC